MEETSENDHNQQRVKQIRNGNRQAFNDLFREKYEVLCRFALGYVDRLQTAEDLVQDVFFDLWKDRRTLDVEQTLKAYLYGMTRHRSLKHLRRKRRRDEWSSNGDLRKAAPEAIPAHAGDLIEQQEQHRKVEQAIEDLPERQRQIFILSRYHDLTYSEIAVALDISIKTVETQMSRALKSLHERLDPILDS